MNSLEQEWIETRENYAPGRITEYVEKGLERMYMGTAPTLSRLSRELKKEHYEYLVGALIGEIFNFAGLKDRFDDDVMITIAQTMKTEYPWIKITELMHFVYLFRLGNFDKFYGKPSGATLMQMFRQYVKQDYDRLRAEFLIKQEKEQRIIEMAQRTTENCSAMIEIEMANLMSPDAKAKALWRYQPYGTALAWAFFVDKTLQKFPGDMDETEQWQWAKDNEAYVKSHPNLNKIA